MTDTRKKKFPLFWLCYGLFFLAMVLFWIYVILYVNRCLVIYQQSQPESVIEELVEQLEKGDATELISFPQTGSRFEDPDLARDRYLDSLNGKTITYKKAADHYNAKEPLYYLYHGDTQIGSVALRETASEPLMFLLTAQEWEITSLEPVLEIGQNAVTIRVPDTFKVTVNGLPVGEQELTGNHWELEQFQYAGEYTQVPVLMEYQIENLLEMPEIEIFDPFGTEVPYTMNDGLIQVSDFPVSQMDARLEAYVLQNAKDYSNFFSRDLEGCRASVDPISHMFPKDSYYLELADNYRKHDMWMYSSHHAPEFANEKVSDYIRYSEDLFSCNVYFEKNMVLVSTGAHRTDITDTTYYYAKIDGDWVIVDMQTIVEE